MGRWGGEGRPPVIEGEGVASRGEKKKKTVDRSCSPAERLDLVKTRKATWVRKGAFTSEGWEKTESEGI